MSQVSRPLQILLVAVLLFAVAWFLALRPRPAAGGGEAQAPAAQAAAPVADPPAQADAAPTAAPSPAPRAARRDPALARGDGAPAASGEVARVRGALRDRKALAIVFFNPSSADDRAVRDELRAIDDFGGRAVAVAVPIAALARFAFITQGVEVTTSPTTVVIGPGGRATTIVGFADRGEIEQHVADALRQRARR